MKAVKSILSIPGRALYQAERVKRRILMALYRPLFAAHGRHFWFDPEGDYSFANICVGNDVFLGIRPSLNAARSKIIIGNKVMFGPEVVIRGGNHTTTLLGRFMCDITEAEKRSDDDRGVIIEDDVWVGTRAIILHGVTVGRGAIVAAGAVVTKNVLPYAVAGGIPARVLKWRWTIAQIIAHEEQLYPPDRRFSVEELQTWRADQ